MPDLSRRNLLAASTAVAAAAALPAAAQAPAPAPGSFKGKSFLITGTSSGFGRLGALHYARLGGRVFATMRNLPRPEAEELRGIAKAEKLDLHVIALDVMSDESVAKAVVEAERINGGPLDVVVNNAGVVIGGPVEVHDTQAAKLQFDTNVLGPHRVIRAVLPGMRAAGRGSIINVSSDTGNTARAEWGAYAVSKWALEALTNNLALEERDAGIRVNTVDPGGMRTAMRRAAYPEEDPASVPPPEAVTGVFLWLASDESRGVTGQRFRARDWTPP